MLGVGFFIQSIYAYRKIELKQFLYPTPLKISTSYVQI